MTTYLSELIDKIKEAELLLENKPNVYEVTVVDSQGNSATIVTPLVHMNIPTKRKHFLALG